MMRDIKQVANNMSIKHNVTLRVIDLPTRKVVAQHAGHNAATNSMLTGIGHYLKGDGVLNQGYAMLMNYVPQYISLGTMGLYNQEEDEEGLPAGIGIAEGDEEQRFTDYMYQSPGYGADGYDSYSNNSRPYLGLGYPYEDRPGEDIENEDGTTTKRSTVNCELISSTFPRSSISYRDLVPEIEAELPHTIDVVYSATISTGALAQFRDPGKDYVFITEAGLWSRSDWVDSGENGLLAGYRIAPPDSENWDMSVAENRQILKENILKVGQNQVVQVIWKIQIGGLDQLGGLDSMYQKDPDELEGELWWWFYKDYKPPDPPDEKKLSWDNWY